MQKDNISNSLTSKHQIAKDINFNEKGKQNAGTMGTSMTAQGSRLKTKLN
jgi:hypothetical protein